MSYDAIVIGGGVNGLVAATVLARAGRRVLLLERRDGLGGQVRGSEFTPGFRSAPLGGEPGWLPQPVARAAGVAVPELAIPESGLTVRVDQGEWLALGNDVRRSAEAIRRYCPADASKWGDFCERLAKQSAVLAALYLLPAPDLDARGFGELVPLLGVARKLRGLGRRDMIELLRTVPMSVQELLDDWFECGPLKAAIAAAALRDVRHGPRSGGTAFALLDRQVGAGAGAIGRTGYWRAGPQALAEALAAAARAQGVEVRAGADVVRILAQDDRVTGVALANGEELPARVVLSSLDPSRTLLGLVDPVWLDPEFLLAVRNIRFRGCTARISYALDALPEVGGLEGPATGRLSLTGSLLELERAADAAKYGGISESPHVELELQSARWPELTAAGAHVLVAHAQWAPYALRAGEWDEPTRERLAERVERVIAQAVPGFSRRVRAREVLAPPDLERRFGLTEGAVSHGEMSLDQILFMRPVPGASRYAMPLDGLYLCGAGAHPGSGVSGGPGWLAAKRVLADL